MQYDLPFVEIYRAREFTFRALPLQLQLQSEIAPSETNAVRFSGSRFSVWNCDGEVIDNTSVKIRRVNALANRCWQSFSPRILLNAHVCVQGTLPTTEDLHETSSRTDPGTDLLLRRVNERRGHVVRITARRTRVGPTLSEAKQSSFRLARAIRRNNVTRHGDRLRAHATQKQFGDARVESALFRAFVIIIIVFLRERDCVNRAAASINPTTIAAD